MRKISITTHTTEIVAKWMILTELKKENEREIKNPKQTPSLNNDRAQGRRASKKREGKTKSMNTSGQITKPPNKAGIETDTLV